VIINGLWPRARQLSHWVTADGLSHTYRFYSVGTDHAGNVEAVPTADRFATLSNQVFQPAPLQVTRLLVQGGAAERSFIQTVDVQFNQANGPNSTSLGRPDRSG